METRSAIAIPSSQPSYTKARSGQHNMIEDMVHYDNWPNTLDAVQNNPGIVKLLHDNQIVLHHYLAKTLDKCSSEALFSFIELVETLRKYRCLDIKPIQEEFLLKLVQFCDSTRSLTGSDRALRWDKKYGIIPANKDVLAVAIKSIENGLCHGGQINYINAITRQICFLVISGYYDLEVSDYMTVFRILLREPLKDDNCYMWSKCIGNIENEEKFKEVHKKFINHCAKMKQEDILESYSNVCDRGVEMLRANSNVFVSTLKEHIDESEKEYVYASLARTGPYPIKQSSSAPDLCGVVTFLVESGFSVSLNKAVEAFGELPKDHRDSCHLYNFVDAFLAAQSQQIEWDSRKFVNQLIGMSSLSQHDETEVYGEFFRLRSRQTCLIDRHRHACKRLQERIPVNSVVALPLYHNAKVEQAPQLTKTEFILLLDINTQGLSSLLRFYYDLGCIVTENNLLTLREFYTSKRDMQGNMLFTSRQETSLRSYISQPRLLRNLCRLAIRKAILCGYVRAVGSLNLPTLLKKYLLMEEYKNDCGKLVFDF